MTVFAWKKGWKEKCVCPGSRETREAHNELIRFNFGYETFFYQLNRFIIIMN